MVQIYRANEIKEEFIEFCKKKSQEYDNIDKYDDCYYTNYYSELLEDNNYDNIIVYKNNNTIIGYGVVYMYKDIPILSSSFLNDDDKAIVYNYLKSYKPEIIINDSNVSHDLEIYPCDLECTYKPTEHEEDTQTYYPTYEQRFYVLDKKYDKILKEKIEDYIEPDGKIEIVKLTQDELNDYIRHLKEIDNYFGLPFAINKSHQFYFAGFKYFSNNNLYNSENINFIVAKCNNNIVGVIKYGHYDQYGIPHTGVNYIDVHAAFRNRHIACDMIKKFNEEIDKNYPLILSQESEYGQKYKMSEHFKKYIHGVDVVSHEELDEYYDRYRERLNQNEER